MGSLQVFSRIVTQQLVYQLAVIELVTVMLPHESSLLFLNSQRGEGWWSVPKPPSSVRLRINRFSSAFVQHSSKQIKKTVDLLPTNAPSSLQAASPLESQGLTRCRSSQQRVHRNRSPLRMPFPSKLASEAKTTSFPSLSHSELRKYITEEQAGSSATFPQPRRVPVFAFHGSAVRACSGP